MLRAYLVWFSDILLLHFQLKWVHSVWGGGEGWTKCFLSVSDGILPSSKLWVCCFNQKGEKLYSIYWKMSTFTDGFRPNWLYRGDPGNFYDLGDWKHLNSIDHLLLLQSINSILIVNFNTTTQVVLGHSFLFSRNFMFSRNAFFVQVQTNHFHIESNPVKLTHQLWYSNKKFFSVD